MFLFQGDYLAKDVELPKVEVGDWIIIHETGGYTMAMYSKFNSILPSPVYAYRAKEGDKVEIVCVKERESVEENLAFWGNEKPRAVN